MKAPTNQTIDIYQTAHQLFERTWDGKRPVRLVGVGVGHVDGSKRQFEQWDVAPEASEPQSLKVACGSRLEIRSFGKAVP